MGVQLIFLKTATDLKQAGENTIVESESEELLLKAVQKTGAGLKVNPLALKNFFRNRTLVRAVAQAGASFAIPLTALLHSRASSRAKLMRELSLFFKLCTRMRAKFSFTDAHARAKFDLKGKREAIATGVLLGLTPPQAKAAASEMRD